jgi:hypothetical protein
VVDVDSTLLIIRKESLRLVDIIHDEAELKSQSFVDVDIKIFLDLKS